MTSEELQAKVSKLKKQVMECKYLIQSLSDNSKY